MIRSLQTRLLIGLAVATSLVLAACGWILFTLIRAELYAEFDATLASEARSLATLVEDRDGSIQTEMFEHGVSKFQPKDRPVHYALWNRDGKRVEQSGGHRSTNLAQFGGSLEKPEFRTVMLPEQQSVRVVGVRFTPYLDDENNGRESGGTKGHGKVTLVVARHTAPVDATLDRIGLLLMGVIGGAVVVSILVTTPIVRMSLHPLARISARIKLMDIDALGERLDTASAPDEVRVVIDCLNGLLDRLHDAFQRERAFSANVAHELRTPLAGLRSTIDVALAKPVESADYRRSLQRCLTICKQAESLTENLLMLARLDANQCQLQPDTVLLDDLLRKAWASVASRADSRGLEVVWSLGEQLELTTDVALLSLILRNLFDNAVSYADQGSRIEADASIAQGVATINVRNAAARLPQDLAQRVFDRFWRADASRSGNGEHAGLGLALCREAARVLDGQLTVNVQDERFTAGLQLHQQISRSKKQA